MCGIVGYVGKKPVFDILTDGLTKLEYRGYDSAGVAVIADGAIRVYKAEGKLKNLKEILNAEKSKISNTSAGIGHIRWATHGGATLENAHPHQCNCGNLVLVHNGIIENFKELKEELTKKGCVFKSQTDTETVAHLIAHEYDSVKSLPQAVRNSLRKIAGAYALCVMHKDEPNMIVVAKKNAPLLIGIGEGENYVASDVPAIIEYTKKAIYLDEKEVGVITPQKVIVTDVYGNIIDKRVEVLPWESASLSKMGYKHFMLKEIHEQPDVIRNVLSDKLKGIDLPIILDEVKLTKEALKSLKRIEIIACGTSLNAGLIGKYIIEDWADISVDVESSSEYIYRRTVTDKDTLVIGVSQSGETADTITAIRQAKAKGAHALIITNRPDSIMAREADSLVPINAGIEVSVAATKSFTAQLISFYLLALHIAEIKQSITQEKAKLIKEELIKLPQKAEMILSNKEEIKDCARKFANTKDFIYISRGINFATALEGALKLKEISYINATGYSAGELKHGPIAMLDESMPVLSILMPGLVFDKILSNSEESKARNAKLIAVTSSKDEGLKGLFDVILNVPEVLEDLSPALTVIPLQLLAYYISEFLGKDVDQPRNLAKSVTVE